MGINPKVEGPKHLIRTVDYGSLAVEDAYRILAERGAPADEGQGFPALYGLLAASEGEGIEVRFAKSAQEPITPV